MILRSRHTRRLDALEAEAGRQRAKVAGAAAKARASLTPGGVIADMGERLGGARALGDCVRDAPAPALLAGFGLAWLIGARLRRGRPAVEAPPRAPEDRPDACPAPSALGAFAFIAGAMAAGASTLPPDEERSALELADRAREGWSYGVRARGEAGGRR